VSKLAHHTYNNPGDDQRAKIYETSKAVGKQSWSTEICCFGQGGTGWAKEYDPTIDGGLNLSRIMYKDFATAHDSAFQWWVALSEMIGSDPYARNDDGWNDGLLYYDPDYATNGNQTLYSTKRYYALGQYSKFVKPGAVAHNVTGAPSGVEVTAYDLPHARTSSRGGTPMGKWVVVVNNHNATDTALNLHFNSRTPVKAKKAVRTSATEDWASVAKPAVRGGKASATLAPRSITTYVFDQKGHGSSAVTGAWQGKQSGKCLTADASGAAINTCSGEDPQEWSYDAKGALKGPNGCLTAGGSGLAAANCTGAADQRWLLNANGQIVSEASGKCLDVSGRATADGSRVTVYTCNGGTNQAWSRQ
jgi:hypothetical protein